MSLADLTWTSDVDRGAWIGPRLLPFGSGQVGSVVPTGFERYIRILHPAGTGPDSTWAARCRQEGKQLHALAQWHSIRAEGYAGGRSSEVDPSDGDLAPAALATLCRTLAHRTPSAPECTFALWNGWGWIGGSPSTALLGDDQPLPPALPPTALTGPLLQLPYREYHLFVGQLDAAGTLGWTSPGGHFWAQSPSLFWPADRSWCVATEIDFDSTLVGGDSALAEAILASSLETFEVSPTDCLHFDADTVNGPPTGAG